MRQEAPSTTVGQIAPEAWRAMSDAARHAGLPLDQWLRTQLFGTTAAGAPPSGMEGANNVAELRRRIEELAGQIGQLSGPAAPSLPTAPDMPSEDMAAAAPAAPESIAPAPMTPEPAAPARPAPVSTGSAYADDRLAAAMREIDHRLEELHLTRPREPAARAPSPASIEAAVAEIAARQSELDRAHAAPPRPEGQAAPRDIPSRETSYREPLPREPLHREPLARETVARDSFAREARPAPIRDAISERFVRDPFANGPFATRAPATATGPAPSAPPAAPAPSSGSTSSRSLSIHDSLATLQGELVGMRQSLATLAPRRAVDELQRVVQQLAERVERSDSRDEELRATLATLRDMIGGLKAPEHPALLMGRIDALERKLDIVNAKVVDGATVARLQAQAGEIRELLARSLSSDSVRLLAEQVSLLATKVSEMAANEDRVIRTAVGSLERRIDTLADRISSQPAPVIPLDDLVSRLDAIQSGLTAARREVPAGLETLIKGLSDRIERIERPIALPDDGPRFDALGRQIDDLARKIEKAVSSAEVSGQLAGIERAVNDLFIQMEETRATFLAAGRQRPPSGPNGTSGSAPNSVAARVRREVASLETRRDSGSEPTAETLPAGIEAAMAAELASLTARPAATAAHADAAPPAAVAEAPVETSPTPPDTPQAAQQAVFTPPPASIPKPFEPQLMRAALEELDRSAEAAIALRVQNAAAPAPVTVDAPLAAAAAPAVEPAPAPRPQTPVADELEVEYRPVDLDAEAAARGIVPSAEPPPAEGAPSRAAFIAQARRATRPAGSKAHVAPPEMRSHIAERHRPKPGRWLARIRAMLLIGLCGSALAYGSWHLLTQLKQEQLRAATGGAATTAVLPPAARPAGAPAPEDITGSVNRSVTPAAPATPPAEAPAASIGPSSLSLPNDLPGGIASQTLRAAALGGDPAAAVEIARRFMDGEGVASNPARAAEWYAYASARGSVPATYRLGTIYEKGMDGVARDIAKARELYEQAAEAGNVAAMHNLGVMLASGVGGQPDYRTAAIWFTRAAERGVRDSQYNLAVLYSRGFGVPASATEAWRWFALAAARGDSEAAAKRDEIAASLDARTLAAARKDVEQWTPLVVDAKANDSIVGWTPGAPQKTASR